MSAKIARNMYGFQEFGLDIRLSVLTTLSLRNTDSTYPIRIILSEVDILYLGAQSSGR
jgi:hypothetical protein